jgi:type IV pilus assembly protein PilX
MVSTYSKQNGFVLIVALGFLAVMTVLVLSTMVGTIQSERMSGSHMERNRAFQAAERALRQGELILRKASEKCVSGCKAADFLPDKIGIGEPIGSPTATLADIPTAFPANGTNDAVWNYPAAGVKLADNETPYSLLINQLNMTPPTDKAGCMPFVIMGRGKGSGSNAEVVLQTVVFLCPQ